MYIESISYRLFVFIQTEETPNPETLKFMPGVTVMVSGTATYISGDGCENSQLAKKLLDTDGIRGVFFSNDFITLTKDADKSWELLKPAVLSIFLDHFTAGFPAVEGEGASKTVEGHAEDHDSDPVVQQIKELLETRVRPAVAQDGGDIIFHSIKDGVVYLEMHGACAGCPSSTATLKSGIENMLRYYLPEVLEVRSI